MSSEEELKKSIEDWRDIVVFNAHNDSLRAFSDATISASPDLDKASGWALATSGAIAGLLVSNADKIIGHYYQLENVKLMLLLLTVSILCGLAQKTLAVSCATHLSVSDAISLKIKDVLSLYSEHEKSIQDMIEKNNLDVSIDFDFKKVILSYANLSPFYIRWFVRKVTAKAFEDPEYSCRRILSVFYRQNIWLILQALAFILFILEAILFL